MLTLVSIYQNIYSVINDKVVYRCHVIIEDAKMTNLTILNDTLHTNLSLLTWKIRILTFVTIYQIIYWVINDKVVNRCHVMIEDAKMTNLTILNDKLYTNLSLLT